MVDTCNKVRESRAIRRERSGVAQWHEMRRWRVVATSLRPSPMLESEAGKGNGASGHNTAREVVPTGKHDLCHPNASKTSLCGHSGRGEVPRVRPRYPTWAMIGVRVTVMPVGPDDAGSRHEVCCVSPGGWQRGKGEGAPYLEQ